MFATHSKSLTEKLITWPLIGICIVKTQIRQNWAQSGQQNIYVDNWSSMHFVINVDLHFSVKIEHNSLSLCLWRPRRSILWFGKHGTSCKNISVVLDFHLQYISPFTRCVINVSLKNIHSSLYLPLGLRYLIPNSTQCSSQYMMPFGCFLSYK